MHLPRSVAPLATAALVAAAVAVPGRALAEPGAAAPSAPVDRGSVRIGAAVGLGGVGYEDSSVDTGAVAFLELGFGGMVTHQVALMLRLGIDSHGFGDTYDESTASQRTMAIGIQAWLAPRLWVGADVGVSNLQVREYGEVVDELADGRTLSGAIGYELMQAESFSLDAQLRAAATSFDAYDGAATRTTLAAQLGLAWF